MKLIERQQLLQFLMGLNDSYQSVRSNILMMTPLPSVSQASSIVLQEEQQREIKPTPVPFDTDTTAFLSHRRPQSFHSKNMIPSTPNLQQHSQLIHTAGSQSQNSLGQPSFPHLPRKSFPQNQGSVQCNYCKKLGHTIEKCYKLQRQRNERGQLDRGRRIAASVQQTDSGLDLATTSSTGNHTLTTEQYSQLLNLLSKQNMEVTQHVDNVPSGFLAGKSFCLLTSRPGCKWIIDSGATDHITPHLHLFCSYQAVSSLCFITMPNGEQVQVRHIGDIQLSLNITLQGLLHVPEFQFNLLSASRLVKSLGLLHYFLGFEISHVHDGITLTQRKFTQDLLKQSGFLDVKPTVTPLPLNCKLVHDEGVPLEDPTSYRTYVGKLNFLSNTRPDISFAVQTLSQFM